MNEATLLHELVSVSAMRTPDRPALKVLKRVISYEQLEQNQQGFASGLVTLGLARGERVAIFLDKRIETVVASFGAPAAGCVFVPINPLLKSAQVVHILRDCNVRALVTSGERLALLQPSLADCEDLQHVVLTDPVAIGDAQRAVVPNIHRWQDLLSAPWSRGHRVIDTDMASILYTSGSTGRPKGVVLSHRNMVAGAKSVASYLENRSDDRLLAALPLSFDAGFSQLTTAFHAGAQAVLLNYLLPKDVLNMLVSERITGLTAVPPLWIQLTQLQWPTSITEHLRYIANTGGRMPLETLKRLREVLPKTKPYLMYGLTEAFRATFLPPEQVGRRPDSIGKAIPNAEILVLREDGSPCDAGEPGELVQRGALVGLGYWNDSEKTAERYRPLPSRESGLMLPEIAVFSGDTVKADEEGYLYFIGRRDEMIKTSGYRVSPTEIEEVVYATELVSECVAFGVSSHALGQAVGLVVAPKDGKSINEQELIALCRDRLPFYMVPAHVGVRLAPLPRNPNGKLDRKLLAAQFEAQLQGKSS